MRVASDYVHVLEGRLRIKVAEVKGSPRTAALVERELTLRKGITAVTANPTTGNVLVLYESAVVTPLDLISALRAIGCLQRRAPLRPAPRSPMLVRRLAETFARATVELAVQRVVLALL
jgi:copper chaperone CopZ